MIGISATTLRGVGLAAAIASLPAWALAQDRPPATAPEKPAREDTRTQLPALLRNSYFSVNVGYVDQPFSQEQLEPGFHARSLRVPPVAVRAILLGHEFNRFVAAQASYQRPVTYVTYTGLAAGGTDRHHVRVNFGSLTLKVRAPLHPRVFIYAEGGLAITSRTGFTEGSAAVVTDAEYASAVGGGGFEFLASPAWQVTGGVTLWPGNSRLRQPRTLVASLGFRYLMRAIPAERVEANRQDGRAFPRGVAQIEYSSPFGYGVNDFVSRKVPVFWGGHAKVDRGFAAHVERNVFHTRKVFALDFGVSAGTYRTRENHDRFFTASLYPLLRFTLVRSAPADFYFAYSLAGPSYISRTRLDGLDTGRHFTFQDFMGVGVFAGRRRNLNLGVKINHYSNGNVFPQNAGVKIPLTFGLGYAF
jgi:hypothetical protein